MARPANRIPALAAATATLLPSLAHAQSIVNIRASSLDQVATDNFLDKTCLANANPDVTDPADGNTIIVPLECCGTQS